MISLFLYVILHFTILILLNNQSSCLELDVLAAKSILP